MIQSIKSKAVLYLVGTFIAGLIAGGVGGYDYAKRRPFPKPDRSKMQNWMIEGLRKELKLSDDQVAQIKPIISETVSELDQCHQEGGRKMTDILEKSNARISPFLSSDQRQALADLERRRQATHSRMPH